MALRIEASSSSRYTAAASLLIATVFISLIICRCGPGVWLGLRYFCHYLFENDSGTPKNRMRISEWSCSCWVRDVYKFTCVRNPWDRNIHAHR